MILYIIVAFISFIYLWFKKKYSFWKDNGFQYLEPSFPFGNMGSVGFKIHFSELMKKSYENFKDEAPAFGIYLFATPSLVVTDLELIKDITTRHFESFHDREFYVNEKADPLWKNLLTAGGQEWKDLRAKLSPTFTSGRIKMMFPIVAEAADRMVNYLKQPELTREPLEMKEVYAEFTTEVIANVAFGLDIKCLGHPENEFRRICKLVFDPPMLDNFKNFIIFAMPKVAKFFNMAMNPQVVIDFFLNTVRENMEYREKNNVRRNDFFQLLLDIKNSDVGLSFNEIAANSFIFFGAGFETSSSAMTFCTYLLALNQDVQDRLRQEIEDIIEKHNGEVTYDAIAEMKYLDMVFNETLRIYPIIDTNFRKCVKDFKIPNTDLVIPKGASIFIPVAAIQTDQKYFENSEKFDPERFTDENVKKRVPYSYMPFSDGPRICIGLRFGTLQAKIGLIKLIKNFKFLPCDKTLVPMVLNPSSNFMSPLGGMWLKLEEIQN